MSRKMNIAFLYIAEAYQCYHGASIALELAARPGVNVVSYYNDPETPRHLERIRMAYGTPPVAYRRLRRSPPTRLMQSIRILGMFKEMVMRDNASELDQYDAIFTLEDTVASARRLGIRRPKLIYSPHGFGDRARGFDARAAAFDFVLVAGDKSATRLLKSGLVTAADHAVIGPVKLEVSARLRVQHRPFFKHQRPTVLYNAHKAPRLTSWHKFIEPMLGQFGQQTRFNLIVAPHVKMFRRRSVSVRSMWEARSTDTIIIDTSSDRLMDMTYADAADIYVGDVSGQVYEFLAVPRPCVFLNARGVQWRDDPNFAHWHLGDVVDDPKDLLSAIGSAPERHDFYRARQEIFAKASLGDRSAGAAERGADAILDFMGRSASVR
jgi:hypothetical protein